MNKSLINKYAEEDKSFPYNFSDSRRSVIGIQGEHNMFWK